MPHPPQVKEEKCVEIETDNIKSKSKMTHAERKMPKS
jgi:hypothetical protein